MIISCYYVKDYYVMYKISKNKSIADKLELNVLRSFTIKTLSIFYKYFLVINN